MLIYGKIRNVSFLILFTIFTLCSCKKLVDVSAPVTSINGFLVYNSDATAIAALTGIYANLSKSGNIATGSSSISFFSGLSADDFTLFSGVATTSASSYYYRNQLTGILNNNFGSDYWKPLYNHIYNANAAIEGLSASTTLTPPVKQQMLGEAKFVRALAYFYLVNIFGDAPLLLSSDERVTAVAKRTPKALVYQQIVADLKDAEAALVDGYVKPDGISLYANGSEERVRPNKYAAAALLARTYLYTNKYDSAEAQASIVINNTAWYTLLPVLNNNLFLKNSKEAIWQLQPTTTGQNTPDGILFLLPSTGPSTTYPVYLSNYLLNSFEAGDQRRYNRNWIDSVKVGSPSIAYYFPCKYKGNTFSTVNGVYPAPTEYVMVLRLGEQFLIRAEARGKQNNTSGGVADLNAVRTRAGLLALPATISQAALLTATQHERQVELFAEWGHRWLDLKRTGAIDTVMQNVTPAKSGGLSWNTYQQLYPILSTDILYNSNLTQNPGY